MNRRPTVFSWWVTPVLTAMIIYGLLSLIAPDAYIYRWPVLVIGFLSWWGAELLVRAANNILSGHDR